MELEPNIDPKVWTQPGAVLLVSCYELGHQPLGLALPLGALRERGYRPATLDLAVDRIDPARVRAARFIGISVPMHTALRLGLNAMDRIRGLNPDAHMCFYGLYASLNAEFLLDRGADSVIGGEFLRPLVEWVGTLAAEQSGTIDGVARRAHLVAPRLERPGPAHASRDGLPPLQRYAQLEREGRRVLAGAVEATHGCLHTCLHCPITPVYRGRFFAVPEDDVMADIRALAALGASHITFADPDFFNGPRHSLRIVRRMHQEMPELTFDLTTKIEHILEHRDAFPELRELGCLFVVSAVESLSDVVLDRLQKGHQRADVLEALRVVRDAGLVLRPSFVAFTPWTTLQEYVELSRFVREQDLIDAVDPVQLAVRLLVPPGSALLPFAAAEAWLGPLEPETFSHRWWHPDPRMDELHARVSAEVEAAARDGHDPALTLHRIEAMACNAAGLAHPPAPDLAPERRRMRGPRLTEDWFC
jgi:radical SAM superfamily enzyme YgiQ (UPF0313 family)